MAKKQVKTKSMEEALWEACNKLRGSIEPGEYKHVVLSLIFLKYASDRFEERYGEISAAGQDMFCEEVAFYAAKNVFYLAPECRWRFLKTNAKQPGLPKLVDDALSRIERDNDSLRGALPHNYYTSLGIDAPKLASLIDEIDTIDTLADKGRDLIGRVYEFFLSKFAIAEGKGKGEFYTPKCIVNLIAEMIQPFEGVIYDPCCGSGGMFVQSLRFVEAHHGTYKDIHVYGQEYTAATYRLAKMNLAIRGIANNLGDHAANTFLDDQHPGLKADFIMANPPFNQKAWRSESQLADDPRWMGYDTPPTSNANYGWILNMVSKLSCTGTAGFILANGALSADGIELAIRRRMIERGIVEAILILPRNLFYSTDISVTLWIVNNCKKARTASVNGRQTHYRDREREVLFMDLRQLGEPFEKKFVRLTEHDIARVANTYHCWQLEGHENYYHDEPEFCRSVATDEIARKGYSLVPSKYIEFRSRDEGADYHERMTQLQSELATVLREEQSTHEALLATMSEIGYEIKL